MALHDVRNQRKMQIIAEKNEFDISDSNYTSYGFLLFQLITKDVYANRRNPRNKSVTGRKILKHFAPSQGRNI
ncbi:hypothetical protein RCL_jg1547.t1 [Rhizophagus clarus]|uniref:Uncharacterized protein n=1 Tax=Rhizophagus clarus TaxID=94130 RepID=A0A8H3L9M6_9GLOM|nr:hypothetical protein RCL_jg1547.t1 [Rhizophagus clarus]